MKISMTMMGFRFFLLSVSFVVAGQATFGALLTPLLLTDFDDTKSQMYFNGAVTASPIGAGSVFATQIQRSAGNGFFANSSPAGPRHLRFGLKKAFPIGSIMVLGSVQPSVLKETATYPGNMTNEDEWISAVRVVNAQIDPSARPTGSDLSVWIFPSVVSTRAIRLSRVSMDSDANPGGAIAGVYVYAERFNNVTAQAQIFTSSGQATAAALNNYRVDGTWENASSGAASVISPSTPERIIMVWPSDVKLAGISTIAAAFSEGLVQRYIGPADTHPRDADESAWETVKAFTGLRYWGSPYQLAIDNIDFPAPATSRAFRIVITKAGDPAIDPSLDGSAFGGKKVFASELAALYALGTDPISKSVVARGCDLPAPIPIPFHLDQDGYVTLVIENTAGKRVRNLIAETFFTAGDQTVFWDGLDESGRLDGVTDGEYTVQGALVAPGTYRARGLVRGGLELHYEFTVNNAGKPAWQVSADGTGGWLSDHRPASDVAYLPAKNELLFVSEVGEASRPGIYTTLAGEKITHLPPFEEGFYVSSHLSQDPAPGAAASIATYSIVYGKRTVYLHSISTNRQQTQLLNLKNWDATKLMGGLAVWGGVPYFSLPDSNVVHVLNTTTRLISASLTVPNPRGITFENSGKLLVLSGTSLIRYTVQSSPAALLAPETLISSGLEDPKRITVDRATGNLYISDWGNSHQVKVYNSSGVFIRAIGTPGPPGVGLYDPSHMNRPHGTAITPDGHLWVAEYDMAPKRISEWALDGTFVNALYGPPKYGGGGHLDSVDKTRFYYTDRDEDDPVPFHIGMEWHIDWATGTNYLYSVYSRWGTNKTADTFPIYPPETAVYLNGRKYMMNSYNGADVNGNFAICGIWEMVNDVAKPVAAFGSELSWPILGGSPFTNNLPSNFPLGQNYFLWSDANGDHTAQPDEISYRLIKTFTSFQANTNLDFITGHGLRVLRKGFAAKGAPLYDLAGATILSNIANITFDVGEAYDGLDGWVVRTGGPMQGFRNGERIWTYPSQWPSLGASHRAPPFNPNPPGMMVGTTRLLGAPFTPVSGEAGEVWCINGNRGDAFLMTTDGLYIGRLFKSIIEAPIWGMPTLPRNALLNDVCLADETFWPSMTQTADGNVYLVAGKSHSSIVRLDGLSTVRRLPAVDFSVTSDQLLAAVDYQREVQACKIINVDKVFVAISAFAPTVDGNLSEWASTNLVAIDPKATGAVMIAQGKLYAAWITESATLATNSGAQANAFFKTGGALDLMIGTDPGASDARKGAVAGDIRLLITKIGNANKAFIYRPVSASGPAVTFTSPVRSLTIQQLEDVSADVQMAGVGGRYEISIPLARLGLNPADGMKIRGDIGVLRGASGATIQRSYAFNKATGIVSDTPTEAELTPELWGHWEFHNLSNRDAWKAIKFGAGASAATVADNADPDNDGLSNLVEYALGLDPLVANTAAQRPKPEIQLIDGKRYLTLTYSQPDTATDVVTRIEAAGTVGPTWTASIVEVSRTGTGTKTITVRDTVPLDSAAMRFLRMNITNP